MEVDDTGIWALRRELGEHARRTDSEIGELRERVHQVELRLARLVGYVMGAAAVGAGGATALVEFLTK